MNESEKEFKELGDRALEAYENKDYTTAKKLFSESLKICFTALSNYLFSKCEAIIDYQENGKFDVTDFTDAMIKSLNDINELRHNIDDYNEYHTVEFIQNDCLGFYLSILNDFAVSWDMTSEGIAIQVRTNFFCKQILESLRKVGDRIANNFSDCEWSLELATKLWKTSCDGFTFIENRTGTLLTEDMKIKKEYVDKIRKYDSDYPAYDIPFEKLPFDEKFEICKREKRIPSRFAYGDANLEKFIIPEGTEIIEKQAFMVSNLKAIVIPKSVKRIEGQAFSTCRSLVSIIFEDGSRLEYIGREAFSRTYIESICIPKNVKIIDNHAFACCPELKKIKFEKGSQLESIGKKAFSQIYWGCKKVVVPKKCKVAEDAFETDCKVKRPLF